MDLTGRTAIITGGASGIGHGICRALAERGADIVVADLNTQGAEVVAAEVAEIGRQSMVVALDVTDPTSIDALTETALVLSQLCFVNSLRNIAIGLCCLVGR